MAENKPEVKEQKPTQVQAGTLEMTVTPNVDFEKLLKEQAKQFEEQQKALVENMTKKMEDVLKKNAELQEELSNLKDHTAEENAILGEQIKAVKEGKEEPKCLPYLPTVLYEVYNEEAGITTIMTGDEVEGIVGLSEYITKKLQAGETEFSKHPYKVKKLEEKENKKDK